MADPQQGQTRLDPVTRWLVLALPFAFLAHDLGEVRGNAELNEATARLTSRSRLASRLARSAQTTDRQVAAAVAVLTAGCVVVAVRAAASPARSAATADFAAATAVVGGHLIGHVGQSIVLRRPMPGLRGGLLVTVPYSVAVLARLHGRGYLDVRRSVRTAATGALALGPVLIGLRLAARRVLR